MKISNTKPDNNSSMKTIKQNISENRLVRIFARDLLSVLLRSTATKMLLAVIL